MQVEKGVAGEAAIVSTCNRTELYCGINDDAAPLFDWFCDYLHLDRDAIKPYIYELPNAEAVQHAFRVASGLDSLVLGEPQILGQMKDAFASAHKAGATGKMLNRLFQQTFSVAKAVRTDTAIGASAVSVASAAVTLAKQIFADLSKQTALLIGAGEMIELCARHLKENGVGHIIVANRTLERAELLATTGPSPISSVPPPRLRSRKAARVDQRRTDALSGKWQAITPAIRRPSSDTSR